MDEIELNNIDKGREEEGRTEQDRGKEETSFTERTEEAEDDYDNIRSRLSPDSIDEGETNEGLEYDDEYDLSERLQDQTFKKEMIRFKTIQALELATGVRFSVSYGENSKELIDNTSDVRVRKKDGVLIKLKYKGEKVILTKEGKIDKRSKSLKEDIKHWKDLEEKEQDPTKKLLYKTAKELCDAKKSYMEVRTNQRPESEDALSMIQEEVERNDLTRFERFKKWAKENLVGVSAVAISVAGIITTVVISGRNAVKKGAKAVGQFGKALANLAKKAGPAIATILNVLAQVLTWGAKALEFLSRNLWIVALFLTYLVYDTVKGRMRKK